MRLLGTDPGTLGRWIPEAVRLVFRGVGQWSAEKTSPEELTVRAEELPPVLAAHVLWLRCFAFGVTPLFTLCRRDGTARLTEADAAAGRSSYLLRWKPGR